MKWLNGKKTAIGAALFLAANILSLITGETSSAVADVINSIAMILTGGGLVHKGYKTAVKHSEAGEEN
jgi:uncharacterized membrane protein